MFERQFEANNPLKQSGKKLEIVEKANTQKREHLKEGEMPIMASILSAGDFVEFAERKVSEHVAVAIVNIMNEGDNVDYYGDLQNLRDLNMSSPEKNSYVISDCDSRDKWSCGFKSCTGMVLVGKNPDGKNVSVMSHQDFDYVSKYPEKFNDDLHLAIEKIKSMTLEGTRDAVLFGGKRWFPREYLESVELLGEVCGEVLGIDPVVISGPSYEANYPTDAYFENETRRIYIVRPKEMENFYLHSFQASEIENQPWYQEFKAGKQY